MRVWRTPTPWWAYTISGAVIGAMVVLVLFSASELSRALAVVAVGFACGSLVACRAGDR